MYTKSGFILFDLSKARETSAGLELYRGSASSIRIFYEGLIFQVVIKAQIASNFMDSLWRSQLQIKEEIYD